MNDIRTERLTLRAPDIAHLDQMNDLVSDFEVTKWTASWPYPADRDFTASRCAPFPPETGFGGPIFLGEELIGAMGVKDCELGYMFGQAHWGNGYATEIARAVVARAFQIYDWDQIKACIFQGNYGSSRVLEKIGFQRVGTCTCHSKAQGKDIDTIDFALTRDNWLAANPYRIETDRLIIRPLADGDWPDLQRIGSNPKVARMMFNVGSPWPKQDVQAWLANSRWRGRPGFRPAVTLKDGTFVGTLGLGGDPCTIAYFLDQQHWGKGYVSEALHAFVADAFTRFQIAELRASHFVDNPASGRVLTKLGFEKIGQATGVSAARLEDAPEVLYRLTLNQFGTKP